MDAQSLFREGVTAIRDHKNLADGRRLLIESLRLEPNNDIAWLWLSRTTGDPGKQLQCIERALAINPDNPQALALKQRLSERNGSSPVAAAPPPAPKTVDKLLTPDEQKQIRTLLDKAQIHLDNERFEEAIDQWIGVLEIQADHEIALANAVRQLSRMKCLDDAKELVWNALNAGTQHPSIFLTAIDIAKRERNFEQADDLRRQFAALPEADAEMIEQMVDYFLESQQLGVAQAMLESALQNHPKNPKLLLRLAEVQEELGDKEAALTSYERVAKQGRRSELGKLANERLDAMTPELTDAERGSALLAVREAAGFAVFFLLLAWQDARLNLALLGASRWLGVALGFVGGYLLVTATSSPQQRFLAARLGGQIPDDPDEETALPILPLSARAIMGLVGAALVVAAFALVFSTALGLVANYTPPNVPTFDEVFSEALGR